MLRIKHFNHVKHFKLNNLLNNISIRLYPFYITYILDNLHFFISNKLLTFRSNKLFYIIKEQYLQTYFL